MITLRPSAERGHFNFGWLDTYHAFSFGEYRDPTKMGFRSLRVINEDRVAPGAGFDAHPHRDMEIITYVLDGAISHKDSTGSRGTIKPGVIQRMSAGSGVVHSEYNASRAEPVHLLQIWIVPNVRGVPPRYEDRPFPEAERQNRLRLIASPDAADGSLEIYQDARVYGAILDPGARVDHAIASGRHAWVQVARGEITLNDLKLGAGDGAAISEEKELRLKADTDADVLVFDLN